MYNITLNLMATHTTSPLAQQALFATGSIKIKSSLAKNKNLDSKLWFDLFKNAPLKDALNLINQELTDQMINVALKDNRKTLRQHLFNTGLKSITETTFQSIKNAKWFTPQLAQLWLTTSKAPSIYLPQIQQVAFSEVELPEPASLMQIQSYKNYTPNIEPASNKGYTLIKEINNTQELAYTFQLLNLITPTLDQIGQPGWTTFISMLPTWDQTILKLLHTAHSLSK